VTFEDAFLWLSFVGIFVETLAAMRATTVRGSTLWAKAWTRVANVPGTACFLPKACKVSDITRSAEIAWGGGLEPMRSKKLVTTRPGQTAST
jgi:hypothetical protein